MHQTHTLTHIMQQHMQRQQSPSSSTLAALQTIFQAAAASEMMVGAVDSNFHWEEQFGASFGSSGSYLSLVMVCRSFEPLEPFFSEEKEPGDETMYALYLICKKFCASFLLCRQDFDEGKGIPLVGAYDGGTMMARRNAFAAQHLTMDAMMADAFSRVHIAVILKNAEDEEKNRKKKKRMESFTVERDVLARVQSLAQRERLHQEKSEAFCMGLMARLGKNSLVRSHLDGDLARMIVQAYEP